MDLLNRDVLSIIIKLSNYLPLRQVCKLFYRLFKLSPERMDALSLYYLQTNPRLVKWRPVPKEELGFEFNNIKQSPCDPGLGREPFSSLSTKEKIIAPYCITLEYIYYQFHKEDGTAIYCCQAYDWHKDTFIDYKINGKLLPSSNYLVTEIMIPTHDHQERPMLTFWKPGQPKLQIDIKNEGSMCNKHQKPIEWGGYYFYHGQIIDLRHGKLAIVEPFNHLILRQGVIDARHNKQWVRLDFRPIINRFS